jgi:hypothetical protein
VFSSKHLNNNNTWLGPIWIVKALSPLIGASIFEEEGFACRATRPMSAIYLNETFVPADELVIDQDGARIVFEFAYGRRYFR